MPRPFLPDAILRRPKPIAWKNSLQPVIRLAKGDVFGWGEESSGLREKTLFQKDPKLETPV
jgi:hypothetical protein